MTLLAETPHGAIRNLLPDGRDAVAWHPALSAEIAAHLSPAHATILATPVPGAAGFRNTRPAPKIPVVWWVIVEPCLGTR